MTGETMNKQTNVASKGGRLQQNVCAVRPSVVPGKAAFSGMVRMSMFLPHTFNRPPSKGGAFTKNRLFNLKATALTILLCLALTCFLAACHSDRHESFYPTLADAKKDGAIERGWIPDFLLQSSHDIHELHGSSSPTTWCAFDFSPSESQGLRSSLKSVGGLPLPVRRVQNPTASWWPTVLQGELHVEQIHQAGFELYFVTESDTSVTTVILLFSIDWANGRGFFYRRPA